MKSGNLNFLEPPGPLQASNGSALTVTFYLLPLTFRSESYSGNTNSKFWREQRLH
jgi:hypothetical protein